MQPRCAGLVPGISIHALREEGDRAMFHTLPSAKKFLSTPSARRATSGFDFFTRRGKNFYPRPPRGGRPILSESIRERDNFYPRPPRGGRPLSPILDDKLPHRFLSTPSARRATKLLHRAVKAIEFLSTPSARRATLTTRQRRCSGLISIHALREEGDHQGAAQGGYVMLFLSTPSARRATTASS